MSVEFKSFFGAIGREEGQIQSIDPKNTETSEKAPPTTKPEKEEENEDKGSATKESGTPPASKEDSQKPPVTDKNVDEEDEGEEIEFSEDDVAKAYTMLADHEVLNLTEEEEEELDQSPDGLAAAVAITVRKKVQEALSSAPKPVIDLYNHIQAGNDPSTFQVQTEINWEEFDMSSDDNKEVALMQYYASIGISQEDAEEKIEDIKQLGKLDKESDFAVGKLAERQASEAEAKADAKKAKEKADADRVANERKNVEKIIDDLDEVAGFKLTKERRQSFKDHIFKRKGRTGKTQLEENMADEGRKIRVAFLDYIDFNKEDITKEVATDLTKKRKRKLSRISDKNLKNSNSSVTVKTRTENKTGTIKFPSIFSAPDE